MELGAPITTTRLDVVTPSFQSSPNSLIAGVERLERKAERLSQGRDIGDEIRKIWDEEKRKDTSRRTLGNPVTSKFKTANKAKSSIKHTRPRRRSTLIEQTSPPITSALLPESVSEILECKIPCNTSSPTISQKTCISVAASEGRSKTSSVYVYTSDARSIQSLGSRSANGNGILGTVLRDSTGNRGNIQPQASRYLSTRLPEGAPSPSPMSTAVSTLSLASRSVNLGESSSTKSIENASEDTRASPPLQIGPLSFEKQKAHRVTLGSRRLENAVSSGVSDSTRHSQLLRLTRSPPSKDTVYYPAPVPMTLNLPSRISQDFPESSQVHRRTRGSSIDYPANVFNDDHSLQVLAGLTQTALKLPDISSLPPKARALFSLDSVQHELEIKHGSVVATLESLLDASVTAPVSLSDTGSAVRISKEPSQICDDGAPTAPVSQHPLTHYKISGQDKRMSMFLPKRGAAREARLPKEESSRRSMFELGPCSSQAANNFQQAASDASPIEFGQWAHDLLTDLEKSRTSPPKVAATGMSERRDDIDDAPTALLEELRLRKERQDYIEQPSKRRNRLQKRTLPTDATIIQAAASVPTMAVTSPITDVAAATVVDRAALHDLGVPSRPILPPSANSLPQFPQHSMPPVTQLPPPNRLPALPRLLPLKAKDRPRSVALLNYQSPRLPQLSPLLVHPQQEERQLAACGSFQHEPGFKPLPPSPGRNQARNDVSESENRNADAMPSPSYHSLHGTPFIRQKSEPTLGNIPTLFSSSTPQLHSSHSNILSMPSSPLTANPVFPQSPEYGVKQSYFAPPFADYRTSGHMDATSGPPPPVHRSTRGIGLGVGFDIGPYGGAEYAHEKLSMQHDHEAEHRRWSVVPQHSWIGTQGPIARSMEGTAGAQRDGMRCRLERGMEWI